MFLLRWGEAVSLWNWTANTPVVQPLHVTWVAVERRCQVKPKDSERKPVPVPLYSQHIQLTLTGKRTQASAMRSRRLMAWAVAWPAGMQGNVLNQKFSTSFRPGVTFVHQY